MILEPRGDSLECPACGFRTRRVPWRVQHNCPTAPSPSPRLAGLGDVVAAVARATGLDRVAQGVAHVLGYADCGCSARREKLNELVPFQESENG